LFYNGKELDDNENEDRLFAGAGDITITYEILFKLWKHNYLFNNNERVKLHF
jgi:hypothetical protein